MSLAAAIPYAITKSRFLFDECADQRRAESEVRLPIKRKKVARRQLLINGQRRDARNGATMVTTDPTTEEGYHRSGKGVGRDVAPWQVERQFLHERLENQR